MSISNTDIPTFWASANKLFSQRHYHGCQNRTTGAIQRKKSNVCLLSVHGVQHFKTANFEDIKPVDLNTGGLVRMLAHMARCHAVYVLQRHRVNNPHLHPAGQTQVEQKLDQLTSPKTIILDIHGAVDNDNFDIALGTGPGRQTREQQRVVQLLEQIFTQAGLRVGVNLPNYSALPKACMANRLKNKRTIVQVELARHLRRPQKPNFAFLEAFLQVIGALDA